MRILAAILLIGLNQLTEADTIPLTIGKDYYITFAGTTTPLDLWSPEAPVRIIRCFDYPWVDVEYRWTPSVEIRDGKQVAPKTKVIRRYLNLDHVVAIKPNDGEAIERDEAVSGNRR